jgi:hypothetical protein
MEFITPLFCTSRVHCQLTTSVTNVDSDAEAEQKDEGVKAMEAAED